MQLRAASRGACGVLCCEALPLGHPGEGLANLTFADLHFSILSGLLIYIAQPADILGFPPYTLPPQIGERESYGFEFTGLCRVCSAGPLASRVPWYKNTAQTYAGIMLWFVFWQSVPWELAHRAPAGSSGARLGHCAARAVVVAALICHFLFYLVPGMLGMKTGLPLYIVGTSTYGVQGGFLMPGFFMGVLQFGWLAVNAYFARSFAVQLRWVWAGTRLQRCICASAVDLVPSPPHSSV